MRTKRRTKSASSNNRSRPSKKSAEAVNRSNESVSITADLHETSVRPAFPTQEKLGVFFRRRQILLPETSTGKVSMVKIQLCNSSDIPLTTIVQLSGVSEGEDVEWTTGKSYPSSSNGAFYIKDSHRRLSLRPKAFCMLPIYFRPMKTSPTNSMALLYVRGTPDYSKFSASKTTKGVKLECEAVLVGTRKR